MKQYDFIVIGSGPAGQRAAIQAAKLGQRVLVVERFPELGGGCLHTGTMPSKTLREAVLYLSGWRQRGFYGRTYRLKDRVTADDLMQRLTITTRHEIEVIRHKLFRNHVETTTGHARFVSPHAVEVEDPHGHRTLYAARHFLIATGSRPARPEGVRFDAVNVVDSDHILKMRDLPRTLVVVGAGVIGVEYASIFNALDVKVTLVDGRASMLDFLDREIVEEFVHHLRDGGVTVLMNEQVAGVDHIDDHNVMVNLKGGKRILADMVLFAAGRVSNTDDLGLAAAGLEPDARGRLSVNENFQTAVPHIYAAGDVIGFPALASTSMEQGRHAASHAFGGTLMASSETFPFGIYSVPEMSVIGITEDEARETGLEFETGTARFRETARGQILGLREGVLKLIVEIGTRRLVGVHIVGEGATELIHIGQAVMALGGTLDYFVTHAFNYPTLAEAYKVAALDAWNKLRPATPIRDGTPVRLAAVEATPALVPAGGSAAGDREPVDEDRAAVRIAPIVDVRPDGDDA